MATPRIPARLPRHDRRRLILVRRSPEPLSRAELRAQAEARIRDCLAAVCLWEDGAWEIGDYRYVVFSVDLGRGVLVYVQCWSEPAEPVWCEVSSGDWSPRTKLFVEGAPARAIEARGFRREEEHGNYGREIDVQDERGAATLAREVLDIFHDAFGYRGQKPLRASLDAGTRAERAWVHSALTPQDLVKLLGLAGFSASIVSKDDERGMAVVGIRWSGLKAMMLMSGRVEHQNLYTILELGPDIDAALRSGTSLTDDVETAAIPLTGGVTAEWLALQVATWFERRQVERRMKKASKGVPQSERLH